MYSWRKLAYHSRRNFKTLRRVATQRPRIEVTYNYRHDMRAVPTVDALVDCELKILGMDDMPLLLEVWNVPLDKMYQRLRRGDKCYSGFIQGRIAHYQWVQTTGRHHIQPAGRHMILKPNHLVIYHVRVADWARGQHLYPYANTVILREFAQRGYTTAWVYTTASNLASQKGIERAGWKFDEGYRALTIGDIFIPLPGKLKEKP